MKFSKTIITLASLGLFVSVAFAGPSSIQSNVTPDILVGGLDVETGTFSGSVLNGASVVRAENARSYNSGLCTFKINFLIYNDSPVKPGQFVTTMSFNGHPNVINSYTVLSDAGIKNYEWLVQLKPGKNKIVVFADQQNNIQEINEQNNILERRVNVIGKCDAQSKLLPPALNKLKGEGNTVPHQAKQNNDARLPSTTAPSDYKPRRKWDPNDARLPSSKLKPQAPTTKLKDKGTTEPQQANQGCKYDPDDARLPCSRKPTMKLINPFE